MSCIILIRKNGEAMKQRTPLSKSDLITHPVRLRIVLTLANAERTPQQIATLLDDVPPSSIYRHLDLLQAGGLVEVVAERKVRGATERTLRLVQHGGDLGADDVRHLRADDHGHMFLVFVTHLLGEFDRYLAQPNTDLVRDLVGFRAITLYATDTEWHHALHTINETLRPLLDVHAQAGRTPRRLATITYPALHEPQEKSS